MRSRNPSAPRATTWGCGCSSGDGRRWCRPTTSAATFRSWPNVPWPWRGRRPRIPYAGLADPGELARNFPELDLLDPELPSVEVLEQRARARRSGGAGDPRREQVGRRIRLCRHRRDGSGHQPRLWRRLSQLGPQPLDNGDRRRGHRDGARLRLLLGAARRRPRSAGAGRVAPPASARSRGSIRARSRPGGCRSFSTAGWPAL